MKFTREIRYKFDLPDRSYDFEVDKVYQCSDELIVISKLEDKSPKREGWGGIAVLRSASAEVSVVYESNSRVVVPITSYIIGPKEGEWCPSNFILIQSLDEIAGYSNKDAILLYSNDKEKVVNNNVSSFLSSRQNSLTSSSKKDALSNKIKFICDSMQSYSGQVQTKEDFYFVMAELLNTKAHILMRSDIIENKVIHFIRSLNPTELPFLSATTKVDGHAICEFKGGNILFQYNQFTSEQSRQMTAVLKQFFHGVDAFLWQEKSGENYYIGLSVQAFFESLVPCMFNTKDLPKMSMNDALPSIYSALDEFPKVPKQNNCNII